MVLDEVRTRPEMMVHVLGRGSGRLYNKFEEPMLALLGIERQRLISGNIYAESALVPDPGACFYPQALVLNQFSRRLKAAMFSTLPRSGDGGSSIHGVRRRETGGDTSRWPGGEKHGPSSARQGSRTCSIVILSRQRFSPSSTARGVEARRRLLAQTRTQRHTLAGSSQSGSSSLKKEGSSVSDVGRVGGGGGGGGSRNKNQKKRALPHRETETETHTGRHRHTYRHGLRHAHAQTHKHTHMHIHEHRHTYTYTYTYTDKDTNTHKEIYEIVMRIGYTDKRKQQTQRHKKKQRRRDGYKNRQGDINKNRQTRQRQLP